MTTEMEQILAHDKPSSALVKTVDALKKSPYMVIGERNTVAKIIFIIGIVEIVLGLISGIFYARYDFDLMEFEWIRSSHFDVASMLVWWICSFFSGMFIIGFAEIIHLLQKIYNAVSSNSKAA